MLRGLLYGLNPIDGVSLGQRIVLHAGVERRAVAPALAKWRLVHPVKQPSGR
jgi:hypothetical protein